jgi:hypothetical protein
MQEWPGVGAEIKHDGYRMIVRRMGDRVRLYTRRGFNWADRYLRVVEALRSLRVRSIVNDGEAVWCGTDGKSDFDKLHSGAQDGQGAWPRSATEPVCHGRRGDRVTPVLYKQFSSRPLQLTISSRDARRSPLPPGFILPCLPTPAKQCKSGPAWVQRSSTTAIA